MGSDGGHLVENVHTLGNLSEDDVLTVEMRESLEAEEELRSVGSGASVCHGEDSGSSVRVLEVLVVEFSSVDGLSTSSVSFGEVTTLGHESWNDSVETASLEVEGLSGLTNSLLSSAESSEVLGGDGGISVEVDDDLACGLTAN